MSPLARNDLKPSEAMRFGAARAKFKTQITGKLCDGQGGYCALGAMFLGYGFTPAEIKAMEATDNNLTYEARTAAADQYNAVLRELGLQDWNADLEDIPSDWIPTANDDSEYTIAEITERLEEVGL